MKPLFIIPCAIMIGSKKEDYLERFFQLQHTIDSILSRFKEPTIHVYELSGNKIAGLFLNDLSKNCQVYTSENDQEVFSIKSGAKKVRLPVVDKIRPAYEKGYIKNATESMIICRALDKIDPKEYDRIFKITGRYFFNQDFILDEHIRYGKITLKNKSKCGHGKKYTKTDYLRSCMYWSACTSMHKELKHGFKQIHNYIMEHSDGRGIASIENGLDLFFSDDLIHSIEHTGVSGRVDGQYFYVD